MAETVAHEVVKYELVRSVAVLTIAHPPANAISIAVTAGIREGLERAEADPACRALVLIGEGEKFFAAGADVTEFGSGGPDTLTAGQNLTREIEASRLPVIAAINGICFGGGCELALACDIRIASNNAKMGQPEIKLGIIPGWGGTQRLPRIIGRGPAMELLLTGDPIDANRALALGLVTAVVEPTELRATVMALAARIADQAPLAVMATKRAVIDGLDRPLRDGLDIERGEFARVFDSEDGREGVSAFLAKRAPQWTGR